MENKVTCNFFYEDPITNRKKLFQEALLHAKRGKVLYIMSEELNELPELSQELTTVSRHYMKMISFLYAKTLNSLIESVSSLSDWQTVPCAIILDDLSQYCSKYKIQNACGVAALLIDAARSCSEILNVNCTLDIAVDSDVGTDYCKILTDLYSLDTE